MKIKLGTDFSGIGAPEKALELVGIEYRSMFACDIDKNAKKSYLANHGTEKWYDDIRKRDHSKTPYCDLYVAGFPCQAFSVAGKRQGFKDPRGTLFYDLFQYIKIQRPKYFILENVKGLVRHDKGNTFKTIMDCLQELDYTIYHKVLNTKDYGLPQNRERIFIVGFRDEHNFQWPEPETLMSFQTIENFLDVKVDKKHYLTKHQINKIKEYNKRHNKKIPFTLKNLITYIKNDVEWIGDVRADMGLRIRKNRLSPCLTTSSVPIIKRRKIRRLTPIECLRLQGFRDFKCVVSDSQLYKQAGNSMSVDVMALLIWEVLEVDAYLDKKNGW